MIKKTKKCVDCGKLKELNQFNVRKNPNKTETIYFNSICRKCMSIRARNWVELNKERFKEYQRDYQRVYQQKLRDNKFGKLLK